MNRGSKTPHKKNTALNLSSGEVVEILSKSEILATLDENGSLEGLQFMPEMEEFCGKRFKVLKNVKKILIEVKGVGMRYMNNTVILDGVTCTGKTHGECRRSCLLFWKEKWLKRVDNN